MTMDSQVKWSGIRELQIERVRVAERNVLYEIAE